MTTGSDPHSKSADAVHEGRPVEAQYVRQGRRGVHVLWILAISLPLAVLAVWGIWALFFSGPFQSTEPHNARQATDAEVFGDTSRPALQTADQDPTAGARGSAADGQQAPTAVETSPEAAQTIPPASAPAQ